MTEGAVRNYPFESADFDGEMRAFGFAGWGFIRTEEIVFHEEVRRMCESNRCGQYGKTWACPPGAGTFEECRARCLRYPRAMVFSGCYELEDCFDAEGMAEGHRRFAASSARLRERLEGDFLLLSNEGCPRCKKCTYPDAPCCFPETLSPSVEGYGIMVYELAKSAGLRYRASPESVSYFGMCCFR